MNIGKLTNITQMEDFLAGSQALAFLVAETADARYRFIGKLLRRFSYSALKRADKNMQRQ